MTALVPSTAPTGRYLVADEVLVGVNHPLIEGMDMRMVAPAAASVYGAQAAYFADSSKYACFKSDQIASNILTMPSVLDDLLDVSAGVTAANRLNTVVLVGSSRDKHKRGTVYEIVPGAPATGEVKWTSASTLTFFADDVTAMGDDTFIEVFNNTDNITQLTGGALTANREYYDVMYTFLTASAAVNLSGITR